MKQTKADLEAKNLMLENKAQSVQDAIEDLTNEIINLKRELALSKSGELSMVATAATYRTIIQDLASIMIREQVPK